MRSKTLRDGLSGPLTIVTMIVQLHAQVISKRQKKTGDLDMGAPLHIVVVGATAVNEEVRFFRVDATQNLSGLLLLYL